MLNRILLSLILLCLGSMSSSALAQDLCTVSQETKERLSAVACGQYAPEAQYRFSGKDCAEKSARARAKDSAIKYIVLEACGEMALARKQLISDQVGLEFASIIARCTDQSFDATGMIERAIADVKRQRGVPQCSASLRGVINRDRRNIEAAYSMTSQPGFVKNALERQNLYIDDEGALYER